jgi:hypothetical protein
MTHDRDIERLVSQWLDDGPSQMPDRVIDGMADGIRHQRQRPAWRLRWKEPTMRPQALAAALAAIVILAVGGLLLLRPSSDRGVGGPAPSQSAVPSAAASTIVGPSANPIASATFRPAVRLTAPVGWTPDDGERSFLVNPPAGSGVAGRAVGLMSGPFVTFKDPSCGDQAPAAVGTSVTEVVASVAADPRLVVTPPQAVTVGGRSGQMVDISVAPTWTGTCDWSAGKGGVLIVSATTTGPAFGIGGTGRDRYTFLDVDGRVIAIDVGTPNGTDFDAFVAEAMPIVQSIQFGP